MTTVPDYSAGDALRNGGYTPAVSVGGINPTFTFYRLYGDYTGSGVCNGTDFNILVSEFNQTLPANLWYIAPMENLLDNGTAFCALSQNFNQGAAGPNSGNILSGPFANAVL